MRRVSTSNFVSEKTWHWIIPSSPGGYTLAHSLVRECRQVGHKATVFNPLEGQASRHGDYQKDVLTDLLDCDSEVVVLLDLGFIRMSQVHAALNKYRRRRNGNQVILHLAGDDPQAFKRRRRFSAQHPTFGRQSGNIAVAQYCDVTLTSDWGSYSAYAASGLRAVWFPYWFDTALTASPRLPREFDVVSTMTPRGGRAEILRELDAQTEFSFSNVSGVPIHEAIQHFSRGKIVLNLASNDEITIRVLEAMGTGSLLATNRISTVSGLDLLFEAEKHYWPVPSAGQGLIGSLIKILHDSARQTKIANCGNEAVLSSHTEKQRFALLDHIVTNFWLTSPR